jgi:SAM-dependent methyltransferase
MRLPLSADKVAAIRRERIRPRLWEPHYLHLSRLRSALAKALDALPSPSGPMLDVFCGTQPYREMIAGSVVGYDIDTHFATVDVVGDMPLPFADGAFSSVLCAQALYLRSDDTDVVAEMHRVLKPSGCAVVTVPCLWRREGAATERRYSRRDLEELFAGWEDVDVTAAGGLGTGAAYFAGSWMDAIGKRVPVFRPALKLATILANVAGVALDWISYPTWQRWPGLLVVVASR